MKYIFKLSRKDVNDYAHKHQYAMMMFNDAGSDYIASRCLNHNLLFHSGFPLFSMSVEKLLKALIFLAKNSQTKLRGKDKHNVYELKKELSVTGDFDLDKFDELLSRIYGHWQQRYFDNPERGNGFDGSDVHRFDELWAHLFKKVNFPIEVLYRTAFVSNLFDETALKFYQSQRNWTLYQNDYFSSLEKEMEEVYNAVKNHLYPRAK